MQQAASSSIQNRKQNALVRVGPLLALALFVSTSSLSAGEPVLTIAMARPEMRFERRLQAIREAAPAITSFSVATAHKTTSTAETWRELLDKPTAVLLRKPVHTTSLYPFPLTRLKSERAHTQSRWASASVEPGFGDLDCVKPVHIYGRNGTGWEEPSCGYVKVHFRF